MRLRSATARLLRRHRGLTSRAILLCREAWPCFLGTSIVTRTKAMANSKMKWLWDWQMRQFQNYRELRNEMFRSDEENGLSCIIIQRNTFSKSMRTYRSAFRDSFEIASVVFLADIDVECAEIHPASGHCLVLLQNFLAWVKSAFCHETEVHPPVKFGENRMILEPFTDLCLTNRHDFISNQIKKSHAITLVWCVVNPLHFRVLLGHSGVNASLHSHYARSHLRQNASKMPTKLLTDLRHTALVLKLPR